MVIHGANTAGFPVDDAIVRRIEELARLRHQTPEQVISEAIDQLERSQAAVQEEEEEEPTETPFEIAQKAGLLGCIDDAPPDLSTNPAYFEGFARD